MQRHKPDILSRNFPVFAVVEFTRGLQFWIPVWVAYELRYITLGQLPIVEAVMASMQLVFDVPTGAFADLVGKKWSVLLGNLFGVAGLLIYMYARSFPVFILYALVLGTGDALISGAEEALLYDSAKEAGRQPEFSKMYAKMSLYQQIGLAVSILLGGLIGAVNPLYAIALTAASRVVATIASFWFVEPAVESAKFTVRGYVVKIRDGMKAIFRTSATRDISLLYIGVGSISWVCNLVFNAPLLTTLGHSAMEMGIFFSAVRIVNGTLLFKVLHLGNLLDKKRTAILFPALLALSLLPGIWYQKYWAMIPVWMILFVSTGRWVVLSQYTNAEFSSSHRATAISTLSMAIGFVYVILSLVSGPVMSAFGSPKVFYSVMGVITLLFVVPVGIKVAFSPEAAHGSGHEKES